MLNLLCVSFSCLEAHRSEEARNLQDLRTLKSPLSIHNITATLILLSTIFFLNKVWQTGCLTSINDSLPQEFRSHFEPFSICKCVWADSRLISLFWTTLQKATKINQNIKILVLKQKSINSPRHNESSKRKASSSALYPSLKRNSSAFQELERLEETQEMWACFQSAVIPTISRPEALIDGEANDLELNFMYVPPSKRWITTLVWTWSLSSI